jgi:transposase
MPIAKSKTESFDFELPLKTNPSEEKILLKRFECGRQLYNNCLGELLKRLDLMRESKAWRNAGKMPQGKDRTASFKALVEKYSFRDYDIQAYALKSKNACHIVDHLDANTCQKIATRAFQAASQYAYGKFGRPRFIGINQFDSVEGKNNSQGIRWFKGMVAWKDLNLSVMLDPKDKHGVQAHALSCRTKYVRLKRRIINGKNRFYALLVQEGFPKVKYLAKDGTVGLDLGPSTIAAVSATEAFLEPFCAELESNQAEIRRSQRRLERSRIANNPEAFNSNKSKKKGVKIKKKSKRYLRELNHYKEVNRRQAARRKALQGRMVNRVLAMGKNVNA